MKQIQKNVTAKKFKFDQSDNSDEVIRDEKAAHAHLERNRW